VCFEILDISPCLWLLVAIIKTLFGLFFFLCSGPVAIYLKVLLRCTIPLGVVSGTSFFEIGKSIIIKKYVILGFVIFHTSACFSGI
jgi:hypothetical protein